MESVTMSCDNILSLPETMDTLSTETLASGIITGGIETTNGVTVAGFTSIARVQVPESILTLVTVVTNHIGLA